MTPEELLRAYRVGIFPMSDRADDPDVFWVRPERRGQLSIRDIHISRSLHKTLKGQKFLVTADRAFESVIEGCAQPRPGLQGNRETWINAPIREAFIALHRMGHAHSIECWRDGALVGGLYGLALGGLFCGESMFSRATDASKVALVHLCARLWKGGFTVLDTQFVNDHLKQFGAYEISNAAYQARLQDALIINADFILQGLTEENLLAQYLAARQRNRRMPEPHP